MISHECLLLSLELGEVRYKPLFLDSEIGPARAGRILAGRTRFSRTWASRTRASRSRRWAINTELGT